MTTAGRVVATTADPATAADAQVPIDRWTMVRTTSRTYRSAEADLGRRAQDVNDQFAALGLGIYLQADVMVDHDQRPGIPRRRAKLSQAVRRTGVEHHHGLGRHREVIWVDQ